MALDGVDGMVIENTVSICTSHTIIHEYDDLVNAIQADQRYKTRRALTAQGKQRASATPA